MDWTADSLVGSTGSPVNSWTDSIGGKVAIARNPVSPPTLTVAALNGHNVVSFSAGEGLQVAAADSPICGATSFTVAVVFQPGTSGANGAQWYSNSGLVDGEQPGVTNDWGLNWNSSNQVAAGIGNPDTTLNEQRPFPGSRTWPCTLGIGRRQHHDAQRGRYPVDPLGPRATLTPAIRVLSISANRARATTPSPATSVRSWSSVPCSVPPTRRSRGLFDLQWLSGRRRRYGELRQRLERYRALHDQRQWSGELCQPLPDEHAARQRQRQRPSVLDRQRHDDRRINCIERRCAVYRP